MKENTNLFATTIKEAQELAKKFNAEEYYTESAANTIFSSIKCAAKKGKYSTNVTLSNSEYLYMQGALSQADDAGFKCIAEYNTIYINWGE